MSMKGGYKIINLEDIPIVTGGAAVTIDNLYKSIQNNHRNVTLVSGITLDNTPRSDVWAAFKVDGTAYVAVLPEIGTIRVNNDDTVTITA